MVLIETRPLATPGSSHRTLIASRGQFSFIRFRDAMKVLCVESPVSGDRVPVNNIVQSSSSPEGDGITM